MVINKFIGGIVGLTVLFILAAALVPVAQAAGDDLNASGVPQGDLFASDGVVWDILMIALFVIAIAVAVGLMTGQLKFAGGK